MFKKSLVPILCVFLSCIVHAGVVSIGMTKKAVPVAENGVAWGGGATFLAGKDAVNADGITFGDRQAVYLQFDLSSIADTITSEAGTSDWKTTSITLSLAETWYPHNTNFYMGAGMFDVSMVTGISWDSLLFDPTTDMATTIESLGEFYHEWEETDQTWETHLYMPTSDYALSLTDSFLSTLTTGSLLDLYLSPNDSTIGLAFFNQNWGGEPLLEIGYSVVPEPATLTCLLGGMVILLTGKRK